MMMMMSDWQLCLLRSTVTWNVYCQRIHTLAYIYIYRHMTGLQMRKLVKTLRR